MCCGSASCPRILQHITRKSEAGIDPQVCRWPTQPPEPQPHPYVADFLQLTSALDCYLMSYLLCVISVDKPFLTGLSINQSTPNQSQDIFDELSLFQFSSTQPNSTGRQQKQWFKQLSGSLWMWKKIWLKFLCILHVTCIVQFSKAMQWEWAQSLLMCWHTAWWMTVKLQLQWFIFPSHSK